ncbi:MAG: glycosyl transferase, partial [Sinomonas sp.]
MTTSIAPDTQATTPPSAANDDGATRRRPSHPGSPPPRLERLAFGKDQPRWVRPSAFGLVIASAFLYLWNLTNSGYANSFYAAAVQA